MANPQKPQVLASAARVYNEKISKRTYSSVAKIPVNTTNVMRILLPSEPKKIMVTDAGGKAVTNIRNSWNSFGKTIFLSFLNHPDGMKVALEW